MKEFPKIVKEFGVKKVSEMTGVPLQTVYHWAQGRNKPHIYLQSKIIKDIEEYKNEHGTTKV